MEFEIPFAGTFENLSALSDDLNSREQAVVYVCHKRGPGEGDYIRFFGVGKAAESEISRRTAYTGEIIVRDAKDGGLILRVKIEDNEDMTPALHWWELLHDAAQRDGWLDAQAKRPNGAGDVRAEPKPWEMIPNHAWDRAAVKLLHEYRTDAEIATALGKNVKTVTNRLGVLRGLYPDIVVTREEMQQRLIEHLKT